MIIAISELSSLSDKTFLVRVTRALLLQLNERLPFIDFFMIHMIDQAKFKARNFIARRRPRIDSDVCLTDPPSRFENFEF